MALFPNSAGTKTPQFPFFQAVEPRSLTPNRLYRVYVLPDELVFIRAGSGGEISAAGAQFGLLGALLSMATSPAKKNQQRREAMDNSALEELVNDHKHNFRIRLDELQSAVLSARSIWIGMFYSLPLHVGVLRLEHPVRGKVRLAIETTEELQKAVKAMSPAFGNKLESKVVWNERKKCFVPKKQR